jgi:hypothetical protein
LFCGALIINCLFQLISSADFHQLISSTDVGINLRAGVHGIQLEHSDQCVGSGLHGGIAAVAPQSYQCV